MKVIVALELLVVSPREEELVRFLAWVKLFKLWTASRTGDLMGINPTSLKMTAAGLAGGLLADEGLWARQAAQVPPADDLRKGLAAGSGVA